MSTQLLQIEETIAWLAVAGIEAVVENDLATPPNPYWIVPKDKNKWHREKLNQRTPPWAIFVRPDGTVLPLIGFYEPGKGWTHEDIEMPVELTEQ